MLKKLPFLFLVFLSVSLIDLSAYAANDGSVDASISRGGRLYNDWMVELDERAPKAPNSRYEGETNTKEEIADSWRCVSCHGWDYKGANGVKGIQGARNKRPDELVSLLKDSNHVYQTFLQNEDLLDLARFLSIGMEDVDLAIDEKGRAKGDVRTQRAFFETVCATCHGADGQSLAGISLGKFAVEQPYLSLHSIYNGHPGAVMPSLRAFDEQMLIDLLAYMQTLPVNASLVSITRGGRLYDNWIMETGYTAPVGIHPSFPRNLDTEIKPKKTWLCVECHGWDYLGQKGSFAEGKHFTGIAGISNSRNKPIRDVVDVLKNRDHEFGAVLHAQDLLDLANFVSQGQVAMDDYIKRNDKTSTGDKERHANYYPTLCGNCHGAKGIAIRTMPALGRVANENPWKALHKILNGHPAEEMPAWRSLDTETIRDLLSFIQSLPQKKRS